MDEDVGRIEWAEARLRDPKTGRRRQLRDPVLQKAAGRPGNRSKQRCPRKEKVVRTVMEWAESVEHADGVPVKM